MKVGFIGLGTMGRHMASNLMKGGHQLVVRIEHRGTAAGNGFDDDALDGGQLAE